MERLGRERSVIYTKYIKQHEIAVSTFERTRAAFPALAMNLDLNPKNVDIAMDIPVQVGLSFHVGLNLQNLDELHLSRRLSGLNGFPVRTPRRLTITSKQSLVCCLENSVS